MSIKEVVLKRGDFTIRGYSESGCGVFFCGVPLQAFCHPEPGKGIDMGKVFVSRLIRAASRVRGERWKEDKKT